MRSAGRTRSCQVSSGAHRYTEPVGSTSTAYTFDARGDRTKATTGSVVATYGYDQVNRLTSFARGTTTASYTYNGDGLRASKKVGSTTTKFVYDTAEGLPLVLSDGASYYLYGPGGTPYAQITTAGVVTYLHADQLGSIRMITDSTGKSAGTATYTAYGTRTTTGTTSAFGYAGQYTDTETGLQWLRARYYDPTTGQFLTVDPLAAATGNRYAYAAGNPITGTDPSGLMDWGQIWTIVAVAVVVVVVATVACILAEPCGLVEAGVAVSAAGAMSFSAGVALAGAEGAVELGVLFGAAAGVADYTWQNAASGSDCPPANSVDSTHLSPTASRQLGGLAGRADETVADVIKSRGGGASQVNQLETGYGQMKLGDVAQRAADGDPQAVKALKMVKQAGTQGKGGK